MTGITFAPGTTTKRGISAGRNMAPFQLICPVENKKMRVDHCHFDNLYQTRILGVRGWVEGVADHNIMKARRGGTTEAVAILSGNYGGDTEGFGNGSWADYPWYGTDKFFFIEDNNIDAVAATDTQQGARFVFRHNYVLNSVVAGHGTEAQAPRGGRVNEVYGNTFHWTASPHGPSGGQRSGTCFWHDNTFIGTAANVPENACTFQNYRQGYVRQKPVWGIADGTSPWDANDTEGNGTFVEGHAPYVFDSGSATSTSPEGTLTDSTKNWTPNQWVGYSIKNTNLTVAYACYITGNTATTITYPNFRVRGVNHLIFKAGDNYKIHRVLRMMDQNGGGKSDLIHGSPPINNTTGTASYAHTVVEPCYSWNNVYTPTNISLGFANVNAAAPTTKLGIDYFNLGKGFPADTTPSAVSSRYTAALNGVAYTGTFTYPHPLVSGAPTPTPSATARSQQHLQKKEAKKVKKAKPKKRRAKKPANDMAERLPRRSHVVNPRRCSHGALRRLDIGLQNDAL
jgi:hypothetical protein